MREAESGKPVELTRRGEPVAILLGRRQYERLASRYRRFSEAYEDFTEEFDLGNWPSIRMRFLLEFETTAILASAKGDRTLPGGRCVGEFSDPGV